MKEGVTKLCKTYNKKRRLSVQARGVQMLPTEADIKKRKANLAKYLKQINPDGSTPEKKAVGHVRGAIRSSWMKSPTKLAYWEMGIIPDMDPNTRTKWLCQCEKCQGMFKIGDIQIDHKKGCNPFTVREDFDSYFENILLVSFEGLQRLCLECHSVKTMLDLLKLDPDLEESWTEARIEKQVIAICKGKGSPEKQWLVDRGVAPLSNKTARREQVKQLLQKQ